MNMLMEPVLFERSGMKFHCSARIIHLADIVDIIGNSIESADHRWDFICQYLSQNKDRLFDSECVNAFQKGFTQTNPLCA